MKADVSRRGFLKGMATGMAAAATIPQSKYLAAFMDDQPMSAAQRLFAFKYGDVKLLGGPLGAQFGRIHASYMSLDDDRLLKPFRHRAGLPDPGEEMGGWYQGPDADNPGQGFGQYLSGLARFGGVTGDQATLKKVKGLVEGFAATVGPDGYSYAGKEASTSSPAYDIDKNQIGLLDAYRWAAVTDAKDLLARIVKGAVPYLPSRAYDRGEQPIQSLGDESYTLPENLFYTYEVTGDPYFRELAQRYLMDKSYFDPLSQGVNVLPGLHAYSHVNALSSAAKAYLVLSNPKYLSAARNGWDMLEQTQQFASGGWGPDEHFVVPNQGLLGESLNTTHSSFETPCGSYAHCKLGRYLIGLTGESRYGDGIERVIYNTVLGAKDPSGTGHVFYYSDYHASAQKLYYHDKWPCCSGTLPQVVADYVLDCYFHAEDGLYVNLFAPSEVRWNFKGNPVKLTQTTNYPEADSSELRVQLATPAEFTIYVRIPGWLRSPAKLSVNERAVSIPAEPKTFAAIHRTWRNNDTIQVQLPFSFRFEPVDEQHPDTVALMWGPLMMVALDSPVEVPKAILSAGGLKASSYTSSQFELLRTPQKLRFKPFYQVNDEMYTTYVRQT
jgi:uncharacterized protein